MKCSGDVAMRQIVRAERLALSAAARPPLVELANERAVGHVSHMPYRPVVQCGDFHHGNFREKMTAGAAPENAAPTA